MHLEIIVYSKMYMEQLEIADKIANKYKCHIIRSDVEPRVLFCAQDIGKILNVKRIRTSIAHFTDAEKIKRLTKTTGGEQQMLFLTYNGLLKILRRTRSSGVFDMAKELNIDMHSKIYSCIEADTLKCIVEAFKNETMIEQYKVDTYRIDLYFPHYNLAIECDEFHHNYSINKSSDAERQQYICDKINCTFIRYAPDDKNFNIFAVINDIYVYIKNYS